MQIIDYFVGIDELCALHFKKHFNLPFWSFFYTHETEIKQQAFSLLFSFL